jgi:predicted membrane-bound spermidine synthase
MKRFSKIISLLIIIAASVLFVLLMSFIFNRSEAFRSVFTGTGSEAFGEVASNSEASIANRTRITAEISMYIFSVITAMQFVAFGIGAVVVNGIRKSSETAKTKLSRLKNAEIFFDVPLYVGLFGTISAFLVMTFSPQSSRLIAYSSTLIGIIFSLLLRLILQYPLLQRITSELSEEK